MKLPLPLKGWQYNVTDPKIVELVDELLIDHTYSQIATILNKRGYKSGQGHRIDRRTVVESPMATSSRPVTQDYEPLAN